MDEAKYREDLKQALVKYIADVYSDPKAPQVRYSRDITPFDVRRAKENKQRADQAPETDSPGVQYSRCISTVSLEEMIISMDETFSQMVFRKLTEKGMSDVECYTKAGIDRKLFSKMRSYSYKPSKPTAILIAITLGLSIRETELLLRKALYQKKRLDY